MGDLTGRTALVTGASRGIGRALALGLARAGADVALPAAVTDAEACVQLAADCASDASSFVTGQALGVDGGQTAA